MYPTIDKKATGACIRQIMAERNVTVKKLQEYLGLSCVQSIYHWLDGKSMPTMDNLYAMSQLFCIPIDRMIRGNRALLLSRFIDLKIGRMMNFIYSSAFPAQRKRFRIEDFMLQVQ